MSTTTSVLIPIVACNGNEQRFFEVCATNKLVTKKKLNFKLDIELAQLQDYGYYPAGKTAQTAYRQLVSYWRAKSPLQQLLTTPPRNYYLHVLSKLSDTMAYDSSSSELGLLLAMLQQRLPYARIYATGSLQISVDDQLPQVIAVDRIIDKTSAILNHISANQNINQQQRILIAFPRKMYNKEFDVNKNNTEKIIGQRLQSFMQAHPNINIDVYYFDKLNENLLAIHPKIINYWRLRRVIWSVPFLILLSLMGWQYQKPILINWEAQKIYPKVNQIINKTPQRAILDDDGKFMILPPCESSSIGNIIFRQGDIIFMAVSIADSSWYRNWFSTPVAVFVGAKSEIRVEPMKFEKNISKMLNEKIYTLAFTTEPPNEESAVIAITNRSLKIDKGKLSYQLNKIAQGATGIAKITTVSGYLDSNYYAVDFRFHLKTAQQCQIEKDIETDI